MLEPNLLSTEAALQGKYNYFHTQITYCNKLCCYNLSKGVQIVLFACWTVTIEQLLHGIRHASMSCLLIPLV